MSNKYNSKTIINELKDKGWYRKNIGKQTGHIVMAHDNNPCVISLPNLSEHVGKGLYSKIERIQKATTVVK